MHPDLRPQPLLVFSTRGNGCTDMSSVTRQTSRHTFSISDYEVTKHWNLSSPACKRAQITNDSSRSAAVINAVNKFSSRCPPLQGNADELTHINGARLKLLHVFYHHLSSVGGFFIFFFFFASESHYMRSQEAQFSKNSLINN